MHPVTTRLLSPLDIGHLTLKNRMIFTPPQPSPSQPKLSCCIQSRQAGLVIASGVPVCSEGQGSSSTPGLYCAEQVTGWKVVTDTFHEVGSLIAAQLWHVGRVATASPGKMTLGDIRMTQQAFVDAAVNAMTAGFDLVELHGASHSLIGQFLATGAHSRQDEYAGSLESRARFLLEIVDTLIGVLGAERIGVRLSPWGLLNDREDCAPHAMALYLAEELNQRNIAYLHVIEWMPGTGPAYPEGFRRWLRAAFKKPLIMCADLNSERSERILLQGLADAVAMTAPFSLYASQTTATATWI
nr:alkene reductase [Pseudomonas gessardii]